MRVCARASSVLRLGDMRPLLPVTATKGPITRLTQTMSVSNPCAWRVTTGRANNSAADSSARTIAAAQTTACATDHARCRRKQQGRD
jgi:hypothetical protein